MKILCFTDNLGSGGSQRQLTMLARLLKQRGNDVFLLTYNQGAHFEPEIEAAHIEHIRLDHFTKRARPLGVRMAALSLKADALIAFQDAPSLYAELAGLPRRHWRLIVSERNVVSIAGQGLMGRLLRIGHFLADTIVTNSHANRAEIERSIRLLRSKVVTIYNAVDIDRFKPRISPKNNEIIELVALSSHKRQKNFAGLAAATALLLDNPELPRFRISWYGDEAADGWREKNKSLVNRLGIAKVLQINDVTAYPEKILAEATSFIQPSLWEGMSNSLCEAMAAGCLVLASDVSDARLIVKEGVSGFLFNPKDPRDIARAIRRILLLPPKEVLEMRQAARETAERLFSAERFINEYESLLRK